MLANVQESTETPSQRVDSLTGDECRIALIRVLGSILATGNTREVPDILHRARLLSGYEMYTADRAWSDLEDAAYEVARVTVNTLGW